MTRIGGLEFREVWLVDFEYSAPPGDICSPICMVAWEYSSGQKIKLWQDELCKRTQPPYPIDSDSLIVAYYASAEVGCHLALRWPLPRRILDLFAEFRNRTNGLSTPSGASLIGALTFYGLDGLGAAEKDSMRHLALRGGPWTAEERAALMDYCESDVRALKRLLSSMEPELDIPRALLRGRYMVAAASMENVGVPIDMTMLKSFRANWPHLQDRLIETIDSHYGVYEGRTFKIDRFARWLISRNISWPKLPTGRLALDDDTFREMARAHPEIASLRELRISLSQMRLSDLAVGTDGRNRCLLSAFRSRTGRNQPSNSKFIFGPSVWLRSLIRAQPGFGLAYLDWSQQEFGIAAALSGDGAMLAAYETGDPYLAFAQQAGAIPRAGTRRTHGPVRDQFKACVLAVQYGMGPDSLAHRIGQPIAQAQTLLQLHRETYSTFWRWSEAARDYAMLHSELKTVFGWTLHIGSNANPRSIQNFPMQANGAEMLRLACCFAIERGVRVCAPVHDAILIEAPLHELGEAVAAASLSMADASAEVLGGFRLRSDEELIRYPDRYVDERGRQMWTTVRDLLSEMVPPEPVHDCTSNPPARDALGVRTRSPGPSINISAPLDLNNAYPDS